MKKAKISNKSRHLFRERGSVLAWTVILTVISIGMASLVVDVGFIQRERARLQRTCDAAALAGARQLPNEDMALEKAVNQSALNGYVLGEEGVTITGERNPDGNHPGWYQVEISKPITYFLAPIMGYTDGVLTMHAAASFTSPLPMYINGSAGEYGTNGIMNLSCFGPYGRYTYGDCYSTKWLDNGDENPYYNDHGYDFNVEIKADYYAKNGTNQIVFQVFDPECYNIGDAANAGVGKVDEIRAAPSYPHPQPSNQKTTTKFQLFAPDCTPDNLEDDVLIAEATYTAGMTSTDMQWTTPAGWSFSLATYGYGKYRVNVETLDGSSENGFNLRAGNPTATGDPAQWFPNNGTEVTALGNLPINFNTSGTVDIDLGYVPPEAAGYTVYINKFDTDVGAKSVLYYDQYGNQWPGSLSGNGTFKLDTIVVPENYPGGKLYAEYQAGSQDTSSWQLYFDGQYTEGPSDLKLVD